MEGWVSYQRSRRADPLPEKLAPAQKRARIWLRGWGSAGRSVGFTYALLETAGPDLPPGMRRKTGRVPPQLWTGFPSIGWGRRGRVKIDKRKRSFKSGTALTLTLLLLGGGKGWLGVSFLGKAGRGFLVRQLPKRTPGCGLREGTCWGQQRKRVFFQEADVRGRGGSARRGAESGRNVGALTPGS